MTLNEQKDECERWRELAANARRQARRAAARAATSPYPEVAERFECEAELNFALALSWTTFAERRAEAFLID